MPKRLISATRLHRVEDAVVEVALQNRLPRFMQRGFRRPYLNKDVFTVLFGLYHFYYAAYLPLYPFQAPDDLFGIYAIFHSVCNMPYTRRGYF